MKTLFISTLLGIASVTFYSCSKSTTNSNTSTTTTQWTLNSTSYKGIITGYNDTTNSLGILNSVDASGNSITIIFYSHPMASGTYIVSDAANSNDCSIETYVSNPSVIYSSTGSACRVT